MARKEKKFHFIYKTTNTLTGRYYYGMHSTNNLDDGYMGSGRRLKYSINKYGKDVHKKEIIEFHSNRKKLVEREKEIVNLNEIAKKGCMNLVIGGKGGLLSVEHGKKLNKMGNEALKEKMKNDEEFLEKYQKLGSERLKILWKRGEIKPFDWTGKTHKTESKRKIGKANSIHQRGEKNSMFGKRWITNGIESKAIDESELSDYLNLEWENGRTLKKSYT